MEKKVVFVDRDGTVIEERNYLSNPEGVALIPGAAKALKKLKENNYDVVLVTNQSGIALKLFTFDELASVQNRLVKLLADEGFVFDDIQICPHKSEDNCECRKPKPGLVKQSQQKLNFDLNGSYVIGDRESDVRLLDFCGGTGILVQTGYGANIELHGVPTFKNLSEAVDWIIECNC